MNFQESTLVASFLKASKDADIDELKSVIQSILKNGISNNDLNTVDNNGRTALSHICTTSLTKVLGALLRLPGIDVNRADIEGNTPLHFAAATGQTEMVTMLTTQSGSLIIDSKNIFGLTPLMKAAVEGHTDCAKRLISALASPSEIDHGRGLRAAQWARLCGRKFCANSIEQLARCQSLKKTGKNIITNNRNAIRSSSANIRNKSSPAACDSAKKLRFVVTSCHKNKLVSDSPDLVTHMKMEKDIQQTVVPKIEVTLIT